MAYDALLPDLKKKLKVTWEDDDDELDKLILRSKAYIEEKTGGTFDYSLDLIAQELLLERCRYVFNNAGDEFAKNYHSDLMGLGLRVAIKQMRSDEDGTVS